MTQTLSLTNGLLCETRGVARIEDLKNQPLKKETLLLLLIVDAFLLGVGCAVVRLTPGQQRMCVCVW